MWLGPSTAAIGKGACSEIAEQRLDRSGAGLPSEVGSTLGSPTRFPLFFRLRFRCRLIPLADAFRYPGGQPGILGLVRVDDHHPLVRDDIFADILAVIAAAHL